MNAVFRRINNFFVIKIINYYPVLLCPNSHIQHYFVGVDGFWKDAKILITTGFKVFFRKYNPVLRQSYIGYT